MLPAARVQHLQALAEGFSLREALTLGLRLLVQEFHQQASAVVGRCDRVTRADALCEEVSKQFGRLALSRGHRVYLVRAVWRYLDEDQMAFEHYIVVVDGVGFDWTARQFDPSAQVPLVLADSDEIEDWLRGIDHRNKYEEPDITEVPVG